MKLQNIGTIDFSKANRQIKDLSHKFLQSKLLRKNKENFNPNQSHQDAAAKLLLEALQKPLLRSLRDLIMIKESVVCERNIFDEVCSMGVSENSDIGEGFKISFANLSIKQEIIVDCESIQPTNAPILLFMVIQNIRKKKMIISFQEIKYFILQRNLSSVNKRLEYAKQEQLRKIIVNKTKQEQILLQVYLKYWSQQTQLLIFFDHFGSKIEKIYKNRLNEYLIAMKQQLTKREAAQHLVRVINTKLFEYGQNLNRVKNNLHLQHCLRKVVIRQLKGPFQQMQLSRPRSPVIFELMNKFQSNLLRESLKILQLNVLRQKRRIKSFSYGFEDLNKIMNKLDYKLGFVKLQNKNQKQQRMLPTKYLVMILKRIEDRQKHWVLRKLNQ
ncbi:unnamed protein product (macronuclear) [Paramecium tetraurelia]|uniref:Uncharacterized protein n=1 Tax=Paramecium tetraurelia TaxID=5888 RepID=A0BVT3_PARTE|nr:uncharacterized protein GSPATT00032502001 [Paramecium tetraurelia]CAK62650.1 unnamed protein product [Paramecium tetraurelia]|eukprot:XP_001430048.1 hypothetical protein (macronuclear) [Paramecium tetraurelia strain d4-2]